MYECVTPSAFYFLRIHIFFRFHYGKVGLHFNPPNRFPFSSPNIKYN